MIWKMLYAALGLALATTGCDDKAKMPLDVCIAAEAKGDLTAATSACEAAVAADPHSPSGKAAAARLVAARAAIEKASAAEIERKREVWQKEAAAEKAAAAAKDARCKKWGVICDSGLQTVESQAACENARKVGAMAGQSCSKCKCWDED